MIEIRNVVKKFDDKVVLNNISFKIEETGVFAVTGRSGIGKTTLLRLIAGMDKPNEGNVITNNLKIAYKFQEPRLMHWLTALENVALVLEEKNSAKEIARTWLEAVGLSDAADLYPDQLSGGMQQRVALARALAFEGDVLLLDEPFSAVDETTKQSLLSLVKQYAKKHAVVLVTHDPDEIEALEAAVISIPEA